MGVGREDGHVRRISQLRKRRRQAYTPRGTLREQKLKKEYPGYYRI
jgi:hypothetical protein